MRVFEVAKITTEKAVRSVVIEKVDNASKCKEGKRQLAERMRNNPTRSEQKMMNLLKANGIDGWKPQVQMLGYIVDFYFGKQKAVLEVDGSIHHQTKEYDTQRDLHFQSRGFVVLRIKNEDIDAKPDQVICRVREFLKRKVRRKKRKITRWQDVPKLSKNHLPKKK